jgi:hypothetical protein
MSNEIIDSMVNRFLSWQLPKDFAPDCGIEFKTPADDAPDHFWPIGTNLFTEDQARAMVEHIIEEPQKEISGPFVHVDDFIDNPRTDAYASWFFNLHRLPAVLKFKFGDLIDQYQLYCDYQGERYRVTGASRLGDVWLTTDFSQSSGYQKRVDVAECSGFSNAP